MNPEKMLEMRKRGFTQREIASTFDVSRSTVHNVLSSVQAEEEEINLELSGSAGSIDEHEVVGIDLQLLDPDEGPFPTWREDSLKEWIYIWRILNR